ncbi:hypothetical protein F53441_13773 [Fusarium austroafricanum]|uniref:F-box domain-containing protein n=1 Tax=Fusarium austroafricanum TaxID=2364996 RepID=A0A8H4NE27_9HYPO|nr:hypothetical protein F53441_13773 [Fusarium austroafricanum]
MDTFDALPVELITSIARYLPFQDVKSLSCTSWLIRNAVIRRLFRTLYIPCPLPSTRSLDEFIEKYQDFISRIYLYVYLRPNTEGPYEGTMPSVWGTLWSAILKKIVRGEILSHIDSFAVEFDPGQFELNGWWGDSFNGGIYVFHDEESWDETLQQEQELIWRAQYNEVWNDISANRNITNLGVSNLPPKIASAWETPEWGTFLGRLTDLDISVFGGDNGCGWCANTLSGFYDFIDNKLPYLVMRKATNVRHLSLEASPDGLFGVADHDGVPLPLKEDHFLHLRSLSLKNIMIGSECLNFLKSRVDCLEELELHDCMCDRSWGEVWRKMRESKAPLRRVAIIQEEAPPLMWKEKYNAGYDNFQDSENAARIRKMLEEDKSLVLWRYASMSMKYGYAVERPDDNIKNFDEGVDQREYLKLLEVVAERNKRTSEFLQD